MMSRSSKMQTLAFNYILELSYENENSFDPGLCDQKLKTTHFDPSGIFYQRDIEVS